jgi:hypothetical protein
MYLNGSGILAWYAEFLLEIDLKMIFKIALISLHLDPDPHCKHENV